MDEENSIEGTSLYVDGLNLALSIKRLGRPEYQQLDLIKLSRRVLHPSDEVRRICYYVAVARHLGEQVKNSWLAYVEALEALGIHVVHGRFKKKTRTVSISGADPASSDAARKLKIRMHEEKETDVNIAMDMISDAKDGKYSKMVLVSGDSDFLPVVRRLLAMGIKIALIAPPFQRVKEYRALEREHPDKMFVHQLSAQDIEACLLDKPVSIMGGDFCLFGGVSGK